MGKAGRHTRVISRRRRGAPVVQIVEIAIRILEPGDTAGLTVPRHMHMAFEHDTRHFVVLERRYGERVSALSSTHAG